MILLFLNKINELAQLTKNYFPLVSHRTFPKHDALTYDF
jgi:hypothetical protein